MLNATTAAPAEGAVTLCLRVLWQGRAHLAVRAGIDALLPPRIHPIRHAHCIHAIPANYQVSKGQLEALAILAVQCQRVYAADRAPKQPLKKGGAGQRGRREGSRLLRSSSPLPSQAQHNTKARAFIPSTNTQELHPDLLPA